MKRKKKKKEDWKFWVIWISFKAKKRFQTSWKCDKKSQFFKNVAKTSFTVDGKLKVRSESEKINLSQNVDKSTIKYPESLNSDTIFIKMWKKPNFLWICLPISCKFNGKVKVRSLDNWSYSKSQELGTFQNVDKSISKSKRLRHWLNNFRISNPRF